MKSARYGILCLFLLASLARADSSAREELVRRVVTAHLALAVLPENSPFVDEILKSARSANPGATEGQWGKVRAEIVPAMLKAVTDGMGKVMENGLSDLSDEELERLLKLQLQMLADPGYGKLNAAMASPPIQREIMRTTALLGMQIGSILNESLRRQGLNEVH